MPSTRCHYRYQLPDDPQQLHCTAVDGAVCAVVRISSTKPLPFIVSAHRTFGAGEKKRDTLQNAGISDVWLVPLHPCPMRQQAERLTREAVECLPRSLYVDEHRDADACLAAAIDSLQRARALLRIDR